MTATTAPKEKREFKTELKQLLHLITHSLYSNKEIFLRELISNASDAVNRVKFNSLDREDLLEGDKDWKIKIRADRAAGTLTISDNGVGMSREAIVENLGTIARSGTRAFLESLKAQAGTTRPELIGQFGVGFYSAFMVADRVTVLSRAAGVPPTDGVRWESDGQGDFTVEPAEKATRGTDVILHLKEEEKEFLQDHRLRQIVRKFSDFIEHPVVMDAEKGEGDKKTVAEEQLNTSKAVWLRGKSDVTPEEYAEFYKQISNDFREPAKVIHYTAEGVNEFRVLLFIPGHRPFEFQFGEGKVGPRLYVQRVLIMDHCEALLPPYLRFVKGVIDCADLPLNISREILQHNPILERIQKDLVKSVLKALRDMQTDEYDKYVGFFRELGDILKEGVSRDWANREKVADLLLFQSLKTPADQFVTLAQYVEAMPADQADVYYLIGEDRELLEQSPYLEAIRSKGYDVLLLTDAIDEFVLPSLNEYKGKKLKAVDREGLEADKKDEGAKKEADERYRKLLDHLKGKLEEVGDVRLSSRLRESAACLVAEEGAASAHLERLMERMGRGDAAKGKRVLELNAEHAAVAALRDLFERSPDDARVEAYARLLYEQAVLAEGSKVKDPAALARRINDLITRDARSS